MKVILISTGPADGTLNQIETIINGVVPPGELQVCHSLNDFSIRLRRFWENYEIAVLVAANKEELETLISLQGLLGNLRIILILPDNNKASVLNGHKLRPRFLTYMDSNLMDLAAVLEKMLELTYSKHSIKRNDRISRVKAGCPEEVITMDKFKDFKADLFNQ
jgi:hypothetical protein